MVCWHWENTEPQPGPYTVILNLVSADSHWLQVAQSWQSFTISSEGSTVNLLCWSQDGKEEDKVPLCPPSVKYPTAGKLQCWLWGGMIQTKRRCPSSLGTALTLYIQMRVHITPRRPPCLQRVVLIVCRRGSQSLHFHPAYIRSCVFKTDLL